MLTAVLAATLDVAEKINQFGAYAGLAAIVGLAVLSLLYFSQAREVKRLREWAGRSPERAAELEAAATQAAQQRLAPHPQARGAAAAASVAGQSTTVSPARPVAGTAPGAPAAPVAGPPARQQVPPGQAVTAAGAPAAAPGAAVPAKPAPSPAKPAVPQAPVPATPAAGTAAAAAAAAAAASRAASSGASAAQQPTTAAPSVTPAPAPQRPAPARPAPAPAAPPPAATPSRPAPQTARAQSAAPLRAPSAAAYQAAGTRSRNDAAQRELGVEHRSPLRSTLLIVGGVIAVAVVVFVLVTQIFGSDDPSTPANTVATPEATTPRSETTAQKTKKKADTPAAVSRGNTTVAVLNGTTTTGLAASESTKLADKGFKAGGTGDAPVKPVETTTIYYAPAQRAAADEVAGVLGLPATSVKAIDATISAVDVVGAANVVVVVGADQATG